MNEKDIEHECNFVVRCDMFVIECGGQFDDRYLVSTLHSYHSSAIYAHQIAKGSVVSSSLLDHHIHTKSKHDTI